MHNLTSHALKRARQRSVPPVVIEWLGEFGHEKFDGRGGIIRYFDQDGLRRMERRLGRHFVRENNRYWRCYLVESAGDGSVVTVGRRTKRIPRT